MNKLLSIDDYIARFPANVQQLLEQVRDTIGTAAPQAKEVISYAMPAFKQHSVLVYFAGYTNHIGFYPTSSGIEAFKDDFIASNYKWSKGAVQFPLDQPLPVDLITRIVTFRLNQDTERAKAKKK
jgi:uncharacterized protein YdhG (YjbR/CyaY superfamily)